MLATVIVLLLTRIQARLNHVAILRAVIVYLMIVIIAILIAIMTRRKWAESEYVEHPVISKSDRTFLDYIKEEYKYIARDKNDILCVYESETFKKGAYWYWGDGSYFRLNPHFNIDFPMVKWSDEEPWLIEDLKNLEVVDSYE